MTDETRQSPTKTVSQRPMTPMQRNALHWMAKKGLTYCVAGYCTDLQPFKYWPSATLSSLEHRGLCSISGKGMKRIARITTAGRRELGGTIAARQLNTSHRPEGS